MTPKEEPEVDKRKFGRRIGAKEIDIIISMTQSGKYTRPDIARKAGVSKMTVYNWQKRLGLIS